MIASYDELQPPDRQYVEETEAALAALDPVAQIEWPSTHRAESDRLQKLRAHSGRVAVFTAPPDAEGHPPPGG